MRFVALIMPSRCYEFIQTLEVLICPYQIIEWMRRYEIFKAGFDNQPAGILRKKIKTVAKGGLTMLQSDFFYSGFSCSLELSGTSASQRAGIIRWAPTQLARRRLDLIIC
jgi:hypothetical protein